MRKIKFRAWHKDYGMCYSLKEPVFSKREFFPFGICVGFSHYPEDIEEWELMQSTGLKDKRGREIYEGDILEYDSKTGEGEVLLENVKKEVKWVSGGTFEGWNVSKSYEKDFEVIGNVYENPKLAADRRGK